MAETPDSLLKPWLEMQCNLTPGIASGLVVLCADEQKPVAVAQWPDVHAADAVLLAVAQTAKEKNKPQAQGHGTGMAVAHPLQIKGRPAGAVVLLLKPEAAGRIKPALMALHQGVSLLEQLLRQEEKQKRQAGLILITSLMATALSQEGFNAAATAIATELATLLSCDRVSIGFKRRDHVEVVAISHNADFNRQQNLVRAIGAAMDEAGDQGASVSYPLPADAPPAIAVSHAELSMHHGSAQICTIPVTIPGKVVGAITLERRPDQPFDSDTVALCVHLACLLAPILQLKHDRERRAHEVMRDAILGFLDRLAGKGINRTKVYTLGAAMIAILLALPIASYRVSAPAHLEGAIQRALVAPVDGYVKQVHAKPGDLVQAEQVLAEMADEEISLERRKLESELAQSDSAYGAALATRDRAQVAMAVARMEETRARLALVTQQMSRIQLKAPFDGVLIKGDLSQSIGAPVRRGEVLMMVAPREGYRIILEVDDRDIRQLNAGQGGTLVLAALPEESLGFRVMRIYPVAEAKGGRNFFEVEARLDQTEGRLRPGLEGVAKVDIGQRALGWIWFHQAFDWLRYKYWAWFA